MRIIEALGALQFLKKELLTFTDIATALGVGRGAISNRHQRADKVYDVLKPVEIEKIEHYFNVSLEKFKTPETDISKEKLKDIVRQILKEESING